LLIVNTKNLNSEERDDLIRQLDNKIAKLTEHERDLAEHTEELGAQKEELTAAIEELVKKNNRLTEVVTQLKERNFELDQVLYRISHDLRAPLLSVKGILSLLAREQQPDPINTYNNHIADRVMQMDHILRSLGSLSKSILEKPELTSASLSEIIRETVARQNDLSAAQHVTINTDLRQDAIYTDTYLLAIIFNELLANAFTFRDLQKKGQIIINTFTQDDNVCIEITDDGEGLSPEILPHIFDIFYRGSGRSRGAGLGLYIARKATGRLGGTLTGTPTGNGSRFTLILPQTPSLTSISDYGVL
jgi:signal transduction histidine kinase